VRAPKALLNLPKEVLILNIIFLFFLLPFAFMPPNIIRTFEDFVKNYLFHIILALFLALKLRKEPEFYKSPLFYLPPALTCLVVSLHHLYSGIKLCLINNLCPSTIFIANKISLLKGFVITSTSYVFVFFFFLSLYFVEKRKNLKFFFLFISFFSLFMQIILGRRASILAIILSGLFISILSKHRATRTIGLSLALGLTFLTGVLLMTPSGKNMLIRDDKIYLLLQEKYAESGSFGMRLYIWPIYLKKALEDPFSGTGIGRKTQKTALSQTNELALKLEHSHNLFLNLWLQAGLHTMLTFLILYLHTLFKVYKMWRSNLEKPIHALLLAFLLAFLVMSMLEGIEEETRFTPFWITSGLIWGLNEKSSLSS
jgi:O-antigen ligase